MKTKTMKRSEWWRLEECKFNSCSIDEDTEAGLIQMEKLVKPLYVKYRYTTEKCIADNGYAWLQIAKKDTNVWLTAMYDKTNTLVECYFDMTSMNYIKPNGDSSFDDLYLDVVFFPNGNIEILDEDELQEAYTKKIITKELFDLANTTARKLINWLQDPIHQHQLITCCNRIYTKLKD